MAACTCICALQVAASGAAPLLNAAEAVVAARRVPEKMFGLLDMHAGVEAALAPLRAALAAGPGSRERASLGAEQAAVVAQLQQVGHAWGRRAASCSAAGAAAHIVCAPCCPCCSCGAAWRARCGRALGSCRTRCCATRRAACPPTAPSTRWSPPRWRCCAARWPTRPPCPSSLPTVRLGEGLQGMLQKKKTCLPALTHACLTTVPSPPPSAASPAGRPGGGLAEEARLLELMGRAVCRMFDTLLSALEAKARASYKPRGLAALHGMNNVAFVAHTLGASREFRAAGEAWLEKNQVGERGPEGWACRWRAAGTGCSRQVP